jgi:hypothetical protein
MFEAPARFASAQSPSGGDECRRLIGKFVA